MNAPLSHTMPSSYQYQASRHCLLLLLIPINSDTIHHPTPSPSFSSFVLNEWFVMHMFVITGTSLAFVVIIDDWTSHMCVHNGFVPFITAKGIPYNFRTLTILHLWQHFFVSILVDWAICRECVRLERRNIKDKTIDHISNCNLFDYCTAHFFQFFKNIVSFGATRRQAKRATKKELKCQPQNRNDIPTNYIFYLQSNGVWSRLFWCQFILLVLVSYCCCFSLHIFLYVVLAFAFIKYVH